MIPRSSFFNGTATTEIYTLSPHDALPIWTRPSTASSTCTRSASRTTRPSCASASTTPPPSSSRQGSTPSRSEEHTSELQSRQYLVCPLLLVKNKTTSA